MVIKFKKTAQIAVLFFLATIPILFGAVHPIITGLYTFSIYSLLGSWLIVNKKQFPVFHISSLGIISFSLFILSVAFSTVPLPLAWIQAISPARFAYIQAANQLSSTNIQYAPLSHHPNAGILFFTFLIALVLYALTLLILLKNDQAFLEKVLYTCAIIGLFEAMYGLVQVTNPEMGVLWLNDIKQFKGMARGTIIYKNQYAALLNMIWPLTFGTALLYFRGQIHKKHSRSVLSQQPRRRKKKKHSHSQTNYRLQAYILLFITSILMLANLFSQSRGGSLSMLLILFILLIIIPGGYQKKIFLASTLLLITIFYGSIIGFTNILERFMLIQQSSEVRLNIWFSSLPMLYDYIFLGAGIGSYITLSPIYLKFFPENLAFDHAHNDYLELAIELGLPLAVFFFCVFLVIFSRTIKKIWPYTKTSLTHLPSSAIIALVSTAALIGFLVHGTVDFGWRLPANLLYATTLISLLQHGAQATEHLLHNKN
ncbi:MAG: O-antigen ligase family protein [Candidatus Electrothrix aestuarii]|uniref:O-antigen ligase family protein n=1 Tax=Candidatus Electrothrix aestuarii TaxID=3062594 RepID=A0AAU8LSU6_9BACT